MKIPSDKYLHFGACAIISALVCTFGLLFGAGFIASAIGGFLCAFFCGLGKEYGDCKAAANFWSWSDILADALGALTARL